MSQHDTQLREALQELLLAYEDRVHLGSLDGVASDARAALSATQPAQAQQSDGYEHDQAMMEGHRNSEEEAYFNARPSRDGDNARHVFCAGFLRGWRSSNVAHSKAPAQAAQGKVLAHVEDWPDDRTPIGLVWDVDPKSVPIGTKLYAQPAGGADVLTRAARDVLAERQRQVSVEGWHATHDDEHDAGAMAKAAACYADEAYRPAHLKQFSCPGSWPWDYEWWKPTDTRRDLVKAGALILAEIERLDRTAISAGLNVVMP